MAKCGLHVCLKVFMVSVNTLFLIFGIVLLASGSYALAADFEAIDATIIKELGIGLIVVGLFSMLLSIAGCYGAIKRKKCPLILYMIFVFIVMVALAGVAYVLFSSKEALTSIENGEETGNSYFDKLNSDLGSRFNNVYCAAIKDPEEFETLLGWVDYNCVGAGNPDHLHMNDKREFSCGTDTSCLAALPNGTTTFKKPNNPCAKVYTTPTAQGTDGWDGCNPGSTDRPIHEIISKDEKISGCNKYPMNAYDYCSRALADVFLDMLVPISSGVAAFAGLMLLLFISAMLLCCYARGQTLEEKYDGKGTFVEFY